PNRLSYGGLKDRHALTVQYLTIFRGPSRKLTHHDIHVEYLGQVPVAYTSHDIRANRFHLTLRALQAEEIPAIQTALEEVAKDGVPNYFDDQRFGSVGDQGEFIGRLLVQGRYEEALKLALAAAYEHDRAAQKKEKSLLRSHWGDWPTCKEKLPRGHARSLVDYLCHHPDDFRGALERLRPELRGLYLSAYQSHLWNRMLALWLEQRCRPEQLLPVRLHLGEVPMHRDLDDTQRQEFATLQLPLPSARVKFEPDDPVKPLMDAVLAKEGLELEQLRLKGFKAMFFSKGERAALCVPGQLTHSAGEDELNAGRSKMILAFELPRGAYATLIV